jgi:Fe-Mn family superoxide dismutase
MISKGAIGTASSYLPRLLSSAAAGKIVLPDLPYDYNALEPFISTDIMQLHHSKHHQTYVTNLNVSLEQYHEAIQKNDVEKQISLQGAIRFNGGGHINHSIFWKNLAPANQGGGGEPSGALATAINATFGSFDAFKTNLSTKSVAVQGSGWGWLAFNKATCRLETLAMPNQDPLASVSPTLVPLLGIDVWEHAYYLQYKNVRPDYVKAIWNVINWKDVEARYAKAIA